MSLASPPLRTERKSALTFEDLPPEIRNEIYEFVLISPEDARMESFLWPRLPTLARSARELQRLGKTIEARNSLLTSEMIALYQSYSDGDIFDLKEVTDLLKPYAESSLCSQLLSVSKMVNLEATPVLYGSNRLALEVCDLPGLFDMIGTSIKHIRHLTIELPGRYKELIKTHLPSLAPATALRSLQLELKNRHLRTPPKNMARMLRPWAMNQIKERTLRDDGREPDASQIAAAFRFGSVYGYLNYTAEVAEALEELLAQAKSKSKSKSQRAQKKA